ncbi:MAG: hypothetical protein B2I17_03360 [Thermoplasmatales archaeon B_DKE]|nr:MAG: hypothetical protein B2I17_03360 [Thermoplasmatales archaeon B_DKE]
MIIGNEKTTPRITIGNNTDGLNMFFHSECLEIATQTITFLQEYAPRIRATLVKPHSKAALEDNWTYKNNYHVTSALILSHIAAGGNWGITDPSGMSVRIDNDNPKIHEAVLSLGDTTRWNSGTPGHYCDLFFIKNGPVGNYALEGGGYIAGRGRHHVAPGSIHPNGNIYGGTELHLVPPVEITKAELIEAFKHLIIGEEKLDRKTQPAEHKPLSPNSLHLKDLIDISNLKQHGSAYQGTHPIHGSETGTNFLVDIEKNVWHCFRDGTGGGPLQWIAVATGVISCKESVPRKVKGDLFWEVIAAAHNQYGLSYEALVKALGGE